MALACAALQFALLACASVAGAATPSYAWATSSLTVVQERGLMPSSAIAAPATQMSRYQFVVAMARLESWRAAHGGPAAQLPTVETGATLPDVDSTTLYAKAVKLGWITPIAGRFAGTLPITGDTSSRAVVGALGMQKSARAFAASMRTALPGLSTNFEIRAHQVYVRTLGLRYNHLQGSEQLEVGPGEAMTNAHVAYMVARASSLDSWRAASLTQYESFALPALGPNQRAVLYAGVQLIGMPYVWAGETEAMQPEGHGGFDCSGFVWRTVLNGSVPQPMREKIGARTSYDLSAIPRKRRIKASKLRPGDVIFFGTRGSKSKPAQNYHTGVYMGSGWFIHSSGGNDGVSISRLDGYWRQHFAWGRRVLRAR